MNARGLAAACATVASLTACFASYPPVPAHNADERLGDRVMVALGKSDMRPVIADFVPERKSDLLDPAQVQHMHTFSFGGGDFLGMREIPRPEGGDTTARYFVATFSHGLENVTIFFDKHHKIVHYRVGASS